MDLLIVLIVLLALGYGGSLSLGYHYGGMIHLLLVVLIVLVIVRLLGR